MKLLCINNKIMFETRNGITYKQLGGGLKEGEVYETKGKAYTNEHGTLCYYIEGLGAKRVVRFTELLDEQESVAEKAISKLKEEFQLN